MLIAISILIVSILLFIISLIITLVTMADSLYLWIGRIKVGQWGDRELWREAVAARARKWLDHTPIVPVSDKSVFYQSSWCSKNIQNWQIGGLLLGLEESDSIRYLSSHPEAFEKDASPIESAFLAYALKHHKLLPARKEEELKTQLLELSSKGTLQYRVTAPDLRYVDTIGLACPFLYSSDLADIADRQIAEFDPILYDGVFPPHTFDPARNLPMGVYDWSRGTGWYILGLISSKNNTDRVLRLASRMLDFQRSDGSFGCFFFNPASRRDSSGTVLAGLLFVKAYEWCGDVRFLESSKKAEAALMSMTRRNGAIDYAQGDTKDIGMYSSRFDIMPFVQGMTLILSKKLDEMAVE